MLRARLRPCRRSIFWLRQGASSSSFGSAALPWMERVRSPMVSTASTYLKMVRKIRWKKKQKATNLLRSKAKHHKSVVNPMICFFAKPLEEPLKVPPNMLKKRTWNHPWLAPRYILACTTFSVSLTWSQHSAQNQMVSGMLKKLGTSTVKLRTFRLQANSFASFTQKWCSLHCTMCCHHQDIQTYCMYMCKKIYAYVYVQIGYIDIDCKGWHCLEEGCNFYAAGNKHVQHALVICVKRHWHRYNIHMIWWIVLQFTLDRGAKNCFPPLPPPELPLCILSWQSM